MPTRPCRGNPPVANLPLKRVAADFKDDVQSAACLGPSDEKRKGIAMYGGGPAALTVARDLAQLGYPAPCLSMPTRRRAA